MNTKKILGVVAVLALVAVAMVGAGAAELHDTQQDSDEASLTINGTTTYGTWVEAINGARTADSNATVTLLNDVTTDQFKGLYNESHTVTIDLGGHDITADKGLIAVQCGTVDITGTGKIISAVSESAPIIWVGACYNEDASAKSATLTVGENVTIVGTDESYAIAVFGYNNGTKTAITDSRKLTVTFNGTINTAVGVGVGSNGIAGLPVDITIGSTAVIYSGDLACYFPGAGAYTINGTVTGDLGGIEFKSGTATVGIGETAVITSNASEATHTTSSSGTSSSGFALVINKNSNYTGNTTVTLGSGATIDGLVGILEDTPSGSSSVTATITDNGAKLMCSKKVSFTESDSALYVTNLNGLKSGYVTLSNDVTIPDETKLTIAEDVTLDTTPSTNGVYITGELDVYGKYVGKISSLSADTLIVRNGGSVVASYSNLGDIKQGVVLEAGSVFAISSDDTSGTTVDDLLTKVKSAATGAQVVKEDATTGTATGVKFTAEYSATSGVSPVVENVTISQENGTTEVGLNVDVSYEVTIPSSISLSSTGTVSTTYGIEMVTKGTHLQTVTMELTSSSNSFKVVRVGGSESVAYTASLDSSLSPALTANSTIVTIYADEDDAEQKVYFGSVGSIPMAGTYSDTLTFTVALDE